MGKAKMGNDNCCNTIEIKEKVFNVENILKAENKNIRNQSKVIPEAKLKNNDFFKNFIEYSVDKSAENPSFFSLVKYKSKLENFDYDSNTQNLNKNCFKNYVNDYQQEKTSKGILEIINYASFRLTFSDFGSKFLKEINKARIDPLGFSQKLLFYYENFEKI